MLDEGRKAYRRGDLDTAEEAFSEAYRLDSSLDTALYNRGLVHLKLLKFGKAVNDFNNYLNTNPADAEAMVLCAEAYFGKEETEPAMQLLDKALALNPKIDWYFMRGQAHMQTQNILAAKNDFNEVLRRSPNHVAALRGLADAHYAENHLLEAQSLYMQAVNLNPNDPLSQLHYGIAQARLTNYTGALNTLTDLVISFDPSVGYSTRGFCQYKLGAFDAARADAQAALQAGISNVDAWHLLGLLEAHDGNARKAIEYFDEAIAINPDHAHAWYNAGKTLYQIKVFDRAASYLTKAIEYEEVKGNAARTLASLYLTLNDKQEACAYFKIASQNTYDPEPEEDTSVFCRD
jgi:tetratricopeptide (TPR) repeat protein